MRYLLIAGLLFLTGCASVNTSSVDTMRGSSSDNLSQVFDKDKQVVYEASKQAIKETDLIVRNEEEGKITATPNRWNTFGNKVFSSILSPAMAQSYVGVYLFITPIDKQTKLEIVQTYDNEMNKGKEYKVSLMNRIKELLSK